MLPHPTSDTLQRNNVYMTGEFRKPKMGEYFVSDEAAIVLQKQCDGAPTHKVCDGRRWIVVKIPDFVVPVGFEVVLRCTNNDITDEQRKQVKGLKIWYRLPRKEWEEFYLTLPKASILPDRVTYDIVFLKKTEPKVTPWTLDNVPLPLVVKKKGTQSVFVSTGIGPRGTPGVTFCRFKLDTTDREILSSKTNNVTPRIFKVSFAKLLDQYTLRDGSPCGTITP